MLFNIAFYGISFADKIADRSYVRFSQYCKESPNTLVDEKFSNIADVNLKGELCCMHICVLCSS